MISEIEIRKFRGIRYARLRLGKELTIVMGGNGEGKSSFRHALKAAFQGGYDPADVNDPVSEGGSAIVIGEEPPSDPRKFPDTKAIVTVQFADKSYARRVVDKARRTSTVDYYSESGERIGGQEEIEKLLNPDAIDPLQFLSEKGEKKARFVEKFLEVPLALAEVQAIVPGDWWHAHFNSKGQCFEKLGAITEACEQRRRAINREKAEMDATIQNLRKGVIYVNEENQDWEGAERATEKAYREAEASYKTARAEVDSESAAARRQADVKLQTDNAAVDAWERAEVERIRAEAHNKRQTNKAAHAEYIADVQRLTAEQIALIEKQHRPILDDCRKDYEAAKADLKKYNEMSGLRVHLKLLDEQFAEKMSASMKLDNAIEALRKLRKEKAEKIPIPGLTMVDGKIQYYDIPLESINTAMRVQLVTCILTKANNKFLVIDDIEHLEPDVRREFLDQLVAAGIQVVACEVVPGPLRVITTERADQ